MPHAPDPIIEHKSQTNENDEQEMKNFVDSKFEITQNTFNVNYEQSGTAEQVKNESCEFQEIDNH